MIVTTSEKRALRLTRDQLAVIAHKDPESTKQLERLFALVNGCCAEPTTASITTPVNLAVVAGGVVDLARTLDVGRYRLHAVILTGGTASVSLSHSTYLQLASADLASTVGEDGSSVIAQQVNTVGLVSSAVAATTTTIDGIISVIVAGTITVRISGSGTLRSGSYFSAERLT